jgi:hypothetical protein
MAQSEFSQKLRHEIEDLEQLLAQAQTALQNVRIEVEHLKGRLRAVKKLAALVEAQKGED